MPRKSAEARAAAHFRLAQAPHQPPRGMNPRAKRLFRSIIDGLAPDHFSEANIGLLVLYCDTLIAIEGVLPSTLTHKRMVDQLLSLASKLRLVPQASIHRRDGRLSEKTGPGIGRNEFGAPCLIGGRALGAAS